MIFQYTWQHVVDGSKTQTRRLVNPNEFAEGCDGEPIAGVYRSTEAKSGGKNKVFKWQVGHTYAVQPGRTKKAVARIRITGIRRERVSDISEEDARAEGAAGRRAFEELWNSIHSKRGTRWADAPDVWALEFNLEE